MNILILPIVLPLLTAAVCLLFWRHLNFQRLIAVLGSLLHLGAACLIFHTVHTNGIVVLRIGSWQTPFGIVFVADLFGAIMVMLTGLIGFTIMLYSLATMDKARVSFGYYPLLLILLAGVSGAFLTGDIFNLYVWFEVMLISSFVLMSLGAERAQIEGSIKYVTLNLISSAVFLAAVGLLYGVAGTLNFASLSLVLEHHAYPGFIAAIATLFLIAFGIKAALFPLFFWLPASYHTPPIAVSALLAGLLTKVGVYALIRVFSLLFIMEPGGYIQPLLLVLAGITMLSGVLGAMAQNDIRRILAFHSISQIGYMIMGLALYTPLALAGSVFFIVHHSLVKTCLFLVSGVIQRLRGSFDLKYLGGLYKSAPWLALLFIIPALSLAGLPPLSGFFAKFILVKAGVEAPHFGIVWAALGCGLLTLFSMTKIWNGAFWKAAPELAAQPQGKISGLMILPVVWLVTLTILMGVFSGPLFDLVLRTGTQILTPANYIDAVLEPR